MRYAVVIQFFREGSEWYVGKSDNLKFAHSPCFITDSVRFVPRFWTKKGAEEYLEAAKLDPLFAGRHGYHLRIKKLWPI